MNTTATRLPIVAYEDKNWFFDMRLREIRSIENPHDYQSLTDFEAEFFSHLVTGVASVTWKDEGRDSDGRSIGPAYAENAAGEIVHNYGCIPWVTAQHAAEAFGVELTEV